MIFLTFLLVLYFLPTLIAAHRGHGAGGWFALNLLLGWTVVGWFALLFSALLSLPRHRVYAPVRRYAGWERF